MKQPQKHAALIKAWADGAEIEFLNPEDSLSNWKLTNNPMWFDDFEYRIKPEPKPDKIFYYRVLSDGVVAHTCRKDGVAWANLKLIVDGETGKLKSAEVIND